MPKPSSTILHLHPSCSKIDAATHLTRCIGAASLNATCRQREISKHPTHTKRPPGNRRPSLQGRIVPTEARPSKLSAQIVGSRYQRVKRFLGLKLLCFQRFTGDSRDLRKLTENSRFRLHDPANAYYSATYQIFGGPANAVAVSRRSPAGRAPCQGNSA